MMATFKDSKLARSKVNPRLWANSLVFLSAALVMFLILGISQFAVDATGSTLSYTQQSSQTTVSSNCNNGTCATFLPLVNATCPDGADPCQQSSQQPTADAPADGDSSDGQAGPTESGAVESPQDESASEGEPAEESNDPPSDAQDGVELADDQETPGNDDAEGTDGDPGTTPPVLDEEPVLDGGPAPDEEPAPDGQSGTTTVPPDAVYLGDTGDAPDSNAVPEISMTAYYTGIAQGIPATFPTAFVYGALSGPFHQPNEVDLRLGSTKTDEQNAHLPSENDDIANIMPASNTANHDEDDGLVEVSGLEYPCSEATLVFDITLTGIIDNPDLAENLVANVFVDFNRDGNWDDVDYCHNAEGGVANDPGVAASSDSGNGSSGDGSSGDGNNGDSGGNGAYSISGPVAEHVLKDYPIEPVEGTSQYAVTFNTFEFNPLLSQEDVWVRIIVSERHDGDLPGDGSGPPFGFLIGETEDYFLQYDDSGDGGIRAGWDG